MTCNVDRPVIGYPLSQVVWIWGMAVCFDGWLAVKDISNLSLYQSALVMFTFCDVAYGISQVVSQFEFSCVFIK